MLGIITEVTLQCVDAFNLEETSVGHTLDYCLENLDNLVHSAEYVKIWAEIHSRSCYLVSQQKTMKETTYAPSCLMEAIMVCIVCEWVAMGTMHDFALFFVDFRATFWDCWNGSCQSSPLPRLLLCGHCLGLHSPIILTSARAGIFLVSPIIFLHFRKVRLLCTMMMLFLPYKILWS